MTPRCRADARASPRSSSWYSRRATITAGTATSTGAALANRSVAPVCDRKTVMPPTAAAQAVTSKTTRGSQRQRRRRPGAAAAGAARPPPPPGPTAAKASVAMPGHQAAGPAGVAPGTRSTASRPGQRGGGHGGDRGAARPEQEQLPQGRAAGPAQGQLGRPAGRDHQGREQQRHQAGDRQARVDEPQQDVHVVAGLDEGGQRLDAGPNDTLSAFAIVRQAARSASATWCAIWFACCVQGLGLAAAARSCRSGSSHWKQQAPLAEDPLDLVGLAGVRDDRAVPALAVADAVEGGRGHERVGSPERRTGIGGLDDPGDVELDHDQLPACSAVSPGR